MADHGYSFMQLVLLFRFIPDDHFCPSHLKDFHAVSFGMCENWRLIYFPKKVFHSHPSTGFSFLFTRESPLNRHWVGWFPGFLTSETHGGGCGPSTAPGLGCSIDDFPSASGTRANPPNRDVEKPLSERETLGFPHLCQFTIPIGSMYGIYIC